MKNNLDNNSPDFPLEEKIVIASKINGIELESVNGNVQYIPNNRIFEVLVKDIDHNTNNKAKLRKIDRWIGRYIKSYGHSIEELFQYSESDFTAKEKDNFKKNYDAWSMEYSLKDKKESDILNYINWYFKASDKSIRACKVWLLKEYKIDLF